MRSSFFDQDHVNTNTAHMCIIIIMQTSNRTYICTGISGIIMIHGTVLCMHMSAILRFIIYKRCNIDEW